MSGLPRLPNETRDRTAIVAVGVLSLPGLATPLRVSTRDFYPSGASVLGGGLVEQLLRTSPSIALPDRWTAGPELPDPPSITFTLYNENRRFNAAFQVDPRGSLVAWYVYDEANPADEELAFVGQIEKPRFLGPGLAEVELTCGGFRERLDAPFLAHPITAALYPAIQPEPVETSGEGAELADGWGTGLHVPLRLIRGPTFEDPAPVYEFAALGTCEVDDARSTATQPPYIENEDFTVDLGQHYAGSDARAMTVLRFGQDIPPDGLTATLTRNHRDVDADDLALWTFGSLRDTLSALAWVPGTDADLGGNSDATTGELVAGPSGIGVAAISAGETLQGYWTCEDLGLSQLETFTLEGRLYRPSSAAVGPVLWSGGGAHGGTNSAGGWAIRVAATGELEFLVDTGAGAAVVLASPSAIPVTTETKFAITRDSSTGDMALRIEDAEVDTATDATAIDYSGGETPMVLGAAVVSSAPVYWAGGLRLSGLRFGQVVRSDAALDEDYFRMRHSPIVALRDLLVSAGETPETAAYESARDSVDAFADGGLKVDGWISDASLDCRAVGGHLAIIPRAALERTAANEIAITVPTAPTSTVAALGFYPESQYRNVQHIESDLASTQEATKTLTTKYRLNRTASGSADTTQKERTKEAVLSRGADQTLELRLVHRHLTAALIAGRERLDRRRRDEQRIVQTQHEGRPAVRGSAVYLDLGAELRRGGYNPAEYNPAAYVDETLASGDYEVLAREILPGGRYQLTLAPLELDLYTPQPGTGIEVDDVIEARPELDLGTDPAIVVESITGQNGVILDAGYHQIGTGDPGPVVALRLALRSSLILGPLVADPSEVSPSIPINNGTVSGATDHPAALASDDAAYVELDDSSLSSHVQIEACTFPDPGLAAGTVTRFEIEARVYYVSGTGTLSVGPGTLQASVIRPPFLRWGLLTASTDLTGPTSGYTTVRADMIAAREDAAEAPWTLAEIQSGTPAAAAVGDLRLAIRCVLPTDAVLRLGMLRAFLDVEQLTAPRALGGFIWYRKAVTDPDAGVTPVPGVTPALGPLSLDFTLSDEPPGLNQYDYWCAVFDDRARFARMFGPLRVIVAS